MERSIYLVFLMLSQKKKKTFAKRLQLDKGVGRITNKFRPDNNASKRELMFFCVFLLIFDEKNG
jgi:hypothetical protein